MCRYWRVSKRVSDGYRYNRKYFKLNKIILLLSAVLMAPVLMADQHSDENRLLKSWGFQFNTSGKLIFKAGSEMDTEYQPWSPDLSNYQVLELEKNSQKILEPLVISSKNKSE